MNQSSPDLQPDLRPEAFDHGSSDHWLAYCYLTGELSDEQAAACEARLASDLSLQRALAECVSLTSGLARLAERPVAATARRSAVAVERRRRSPAWTVAAVGLLAAGLLVTSASLMQQPASPLPLPLGQDRGGAGLDPAEVVAMWSQLGDEETPSEERDEDLERFEPLIDEELEIPDWMLVAVFAESVEADGDEPAQEQPL